MSCQVVVGRSPSQIGAHTVVKRLLGAVLVFAASTKLYDDLYRDSWGTFPIISTGLATLELLLAIALLLDAWPIWSWRAAIVLFGTFACVSLAKLLTGYDDCGCFGRFSVRPIFSLILDLVAVAALLMWPPRINGSPLYLGTWTSAFVFSVSVVAVTFGGYRILDRQGLIGRGADSIEPEEWIGQQFPPNLIATDVDRRIRTGTWAVVFHRHGCEACSALYAKYAQVIEARTPVANEINVAFVEVPPYSHGSNAAPPITPRKDFLLARLSIGDSSFVRAPAQLLLNDGIVRLVEYDASSILLHGVDDRNETIALAFKDSSSLDRDSRAATDEHKRVPKNADTAYEAHEGWLPDYRSIRHRRLINEVACGPRSLIAVLESLAIDLTEDERRILVSAAGTNGIDMLRLKKLAEGLGAHAEGVQASIGTLRKVGLPAIVHLRSAGFAAITGYTPDAVEIVYPTGRKATVNDDDLVEAYGVSGFALILSTAPISQSKLVLPESSATHNGRQRTGLILSSSMLAIGRIHSTTWNGELTLSNYTNREITIKDPAVSCSCMTARLERSRLLPDESTILHVRGRQSAWGSFNHSILVKTVGEKPISVTVPIHGFLESAIFFDRPIVSLRRILVDDRAEASIPFELADSFDLADIVPSMEGDAPVALSVERDLDSDRPHLIVDWLGTSDPGWHNYRIELRTPSIPDSPSTPVWLAVEVVPRVTASPPSLLIQRDEIDRRWSRTVYLHTSDRDPDHSPISYDWSDPAFEAVVVVSPAPGNTAPTQLTIAPREDALMDMEHLIGRSAELRVRLGDAVATIKLFLGANAFEDTAEPSNSAEPVSVN